MLTQASVLEMPANIRESNQHMLMIIIKANNFLNKRSALFKTKITSDFNIDSILSVTQNISLY